MEKVIRIIIVIFLLFSCNKKENFNFVKFETIIYNDTIKKIELDRGILKLNNYYLGGSSQLIYKDTFPKWIKDFNSPEFSFSDYKFKPSISDIEPPYIIFKNQNDSILNVIKYKDSLKFKIQNF
jgi:hypothetical protein